MAKLLILARPALLFSLLLATACGADPLEGKPGQYPNTGQTAYPSVATCTQLNSGKPPFSSPGALGAPDGQTVDMQSCPTLDLTWTSGTVLDDNDKGSGLDDKKADIRLHVHRVAGRTRVEASQDGITYKVVGFLGSTPTNFSKSTCLADTSASEALIYLSKCNTITNVHHLRLTRYTKITGSVVLDAVQAIHFEAKSK